MSASKQMAGRGAYRVAQAKVRRILVIDLEPTPYKTDLWNTFSDSDEVDLFVVYTERKNWAPDGGHNYLKWPSNRHASLTLEGKGLYGGFRSALIVAKTILSSKTDLICIAGYVHLAMVMAIFCAIVLRRHFVVHADEFNNTRPEGRFAALKWLIRESLRALIFKFGDAVLVCGKRGIESALAAGCPREKTLDFPYVIDVQRMRLDEPSSCPHECLEDVKAGRLILFFSGRMIPRKGLPTLFQALSADLRGKDWILWIEGDGPELENYQKLAFEAGLADRARFLGFCQYDLHSWLSRSVDIVIVPSLIDTWGIVVDEGLQLGKVVISSDATGSGYDRIQDGSNGFIFPAGNAPSLSLILGRLIDDPSLRARVCQLALAGKKNFGPADNLAKLLLLIKNEMRQ